MRITKTIATDVASQLVQAKKIELKTLRDNQAEFITDIYEASLSDLIKNAFKKHKGFIYSGSSIRLNGEGLSVGYKNYPLSKELPKCNSCPSFPLTSEQSAIVVDFENKIDTKEKEVKELFNNIEVALINLRTYGNVEKEFPEAFKLLPPANINTGLIINIKDIRCKLDAVNC
jgi:hypothetical protein